jgi:hypothetical protein
MVLNVPQTCSAANVEAVCCGAREKRVPCTGAGFGPQKLDLGARNVNGEEKADACLMFAGNGLE